MISNNMIYIRNRRLNTPFDTFIIILKNKQLMWNFIERKKIKLKQVRWFYIHKTKIEFLYQNCKIFEKNIF
jgi:hypothetical protein